MIRGGYKIINLKETNFTDGTAMMIPGIYDSIESTRKPTLVSGLILDDTEYQDAFVSFEVQGSNFVGKIFNGDAEIKITITDTDAVTVAQV